LKKPKTKRNIVDLQQLYHIITSGYFQCHFLLEFFTVLVR